MTSSDEVAGAAGVGEVALDRQLEAAAVAQTGERVVRGEVARLSSRRADSIAPIAWFANTRSACSASSEGSSRSFGSSTHIIPSSRPAESCSGTTSQWWSQASGPRPLETDEYTPPKSGARSTATSRSMIKQPSRMYAGSSSCSSAATGTSGNSAARSGVKPTPDSGTSLPSVGEEGDHLVEAERLARPPADRVEDLLRRPALGQLRRYRQQVLDRGAVPAPELGRLGLLDRDGRVRDHRAQQLELDRRRAAAGLRLVDGHDPQQRAVAGAHRHHQRVVRLPRVGRVGDLELRRVDLHPLAGPVVLAGGDEVGALLEEALAQQPGPVLHAGGLAHQQLLRRLVAAHDDDLEVVPGGAVEVDDDRAVAQRAGDRAGDGFQHGAQLATGADRGGDVEEAAQAVDSGVVHLWVIGNSSRTLTSHNCGKKRLSTVPRRYSTPRDPPVPGREPISLAAISVWWKRQR